MQLKDSWEHYYSHSGKASDIARQLSFAGLGLIWIFKSTSEGPELLPSDLLLPGLLIASALAADLLQYFIASLCWFFFTRFQEKRVDTKEDFRAPAWINRPAVLLWLAKIVLVGSAYCLILRHMLVLLPH